MSYLSKNISNLRLKDFGINPEAVSGKSKELPRPSAGEMFLKGPIPFDWLTLAANQPTKALHVGVILWHLGALNKNRTVKLSMKNLREFGVKRNAVYRALKSLEAANLISVQRHPGRCPIVTINQFNK